MDTVITFDSVHHALKTESKFKKSRFTVSLISTPRSISSHCGFSVLVESTSWENVLNWLKEMKLKYNHLYEKEIRKGVKYYEQKT